MKHTCPHCGAEREVNAGSFPSGGMTLQCFNCFNSFNVIEADPASSSKDKPNLGVGSGGFSSDLFEDRGSFGFDFDEPPRPSHSVPRSSATSASVSPSASSGSGLDPQRVKNTADLFAARPQKASSQGSPQSLSDLPELVTGRRAPLKVFTPPPDLNSSTPSESPELYAVQSAAPESPELYAVQSAAPASPELYAVQSAAPASPELYAVQSAAPASPELYAVQSKGSSPLEFGGLNDLFDQEDEDEPETIYDASSQGKGFIQQLKQQTGNEEVLFDRDPSFAQSPLFSGGGSFATGDGLFELDVDRSYDFRAPQSTSSTEIAPTRETPAPVIEQVAPPPVAAALPPPLIQAPPQQASLVFEMPSDASQEELDDELMEIAVEEEEREGQASEKEAEDISSGDEEKSQETQEKPKGKSSKSLLLVALLAGLIALVMMQRPDLLSSLIPMDDQQEVQEPRRGTRGSTRPRTQVQGRAGATQGVTASGAQVQSPQGDPDPDVQGERRGMESSESTSASLRQISSAARGDQVERPTTQATDTSAQSSWFSSLGDLVSGFTEKSSTAPLKHAPLLSKNTSLDSVGFQSKLDELKANPDQSDLEQIEALSLGALFFGMKDTLWAQEANTAAERVSPENASTHQGTVALAALQLVQGIDGAEEHAIAIGKARPREALAQEIMGHALLNRGQTQAAQQAFEAAQRLDKSRTFSRQRFAEVALLNGEAALAQRELKGLIENGYGGPQVQLKMAQAQLQRGDTDEAFGWIRNLLQTPDGQLTRTERSETLFTLAEVLKQSIQPLQSRATRTETEDAQLAAQEQARIEALREGLSLQPDASVQLSRLLKPYEDARNWKGALEEIQKLSQRSGGSALLTLREVEMLRNIDRSDKAQEKLEEALQRYPQNPEVYIAQGRAWQREHNYTQAKAAYQRAHQLAPSSPEPLLALADLMVKEAKVKEAQAFLAHESNQRPWSAPLHSGLGDLKLKLGLTSGQRTLFEEAAEAYDQALEINPSFSEARAQRAKARLELGNPEGALKDLQRLKQQGYTGDLSFELGRAQQALGKYPEAQKYFQQVLDQDRENIDALRAMGSLMKSQNKRAEAQRFYEQAIAVSSRDPQARYELGRLALEANNPDRAILHLRIASETKQQDPTLQYWYGRALEAQGDTKNASEIRDAYERAAALIERIEETPPDQCDIHYRVGIVHSRQSRELSLALNNFTRATKCAPKRPDTWSKLAETYQKLGNRDEVMKHYKQALKLDPSYVPALLGMTREYLSSVPPKTALAKKSLDQILKRDKKNPEAHYHMCTLMQSTSRRKAKSYCQQYLKLAPQGEFADVASEIIRSL